MAFTLPAIVLNNSARVGGLLPAIVLNNSAIGPMFLPTIVLNNSARTGMFIPPIYLTEQQPSTYLIDGTGGLTTFGVASRSFTLNGVNVNDPFVYSISASGSVNVTGTAPVTTVNLQRYELYGTGTFQLGSTAPVTTNWTAFTGRGSVGITGSATIGSTAVTTAIVASVPVPTASIVVVNPPAATVTARVPVPQALMTGVTPVSATVASTLPSVRGVMTGEQPVYATVAARVPAVQGASTGVELVLSNIRAVQRSVEALLTGAVSAVGVINARTTVPAARLQTQRPLVYKGTTVMNTSTSGVTEYTGYGFNSFATINGVTYAANATGIYKVDTGSLDVTAPIQASFETGELDFGSDTLKHLTDMYMSMRADGDLTLSISTDENEPYEYTMQPFDVATLKTRRAPIGKGLRGKYWKIGVANTDGCSFDIDSATVSVAEVARRI